MSTMTAQQATVETLTAEVRTLVVGARQVTLSIANQLDVVPLDELRVMGRISLRKDGQHVIGSDRNGVLSLATYDPDPISTIWRLYPGDSLGGGYITVCGGWPLTVGSNYYELSLDGAPFLASANAAALRQCGYRGHYRGGSASCEHWKADTDESEAWLRAEIQGFAIRVRAMNLRSTVAKASPLLVLAGLR